MNIKKISEQLDESLTLKTIAQAYSEISSSRLGNIRSDMESNIIFAKEIGDVSFLVKTEAIKRGLTLPLKKVGIIHVCITSNNRFYGNLERPLVRYFAESTQKIALSSPQIPQIRIVIGKTGATYLSSIKYNLPFKSLIFGKDFPNPQEFQSLYGEVKDYQTALVYHSRFKTVITQIPVVSDISQSIILPDKNQDPLRFIFEPEIEEILKFFEGQIQQILLDQTFLESELSRTASRLTSMDTAQSNADDVVKIQKKALSSARRSEDNNKLLEIISATSLKRRVKYG